jgi:hypothetical protein
MLRTSVAGVFDLKPEDDLKYKGKAFVKRGAQWPLYGSDAASRLSPDGRFLAVNSWDGEMRICPELALGCQDRIQGNYYIAIYNAASATLVLPLSGEFQGVEPRALFSRSAWASSRYYVLPLDTQNMKRFVLCDVQ